MEQSYQGLPDEKRSFFESGTWALGKDKLTLTNSYGEKSYYLPREDKPLRWFPQEPWRLKRGFASVTTNARSNLPSSIEGRIL